MWARGRWGLRHKEPRRSEWTLKLSGYTKHLLPGGGSARARSEEKLQFILYESISRGVELLHLQSHTCGFSPQQRTLYVLPTLLHAHTAAVSDFNLVFLWWVQCSVSAPPSCSGVIPQPYQQVSLVNNLERPAPVSVIRLHTNHPHSSAETLQIYCVRTHFTVTSLPVTAQVFGCR